MIRIIPSSTILLITVVSVHAQTFNRPRDLALNRIFEMKVYSFNILKDGTVGDSAISSTALFNNAGYSLTERDFKEDGSVLHKQITGYNADTLIKSIIGYDGEDWKSTRETFEYDKSGNNIHRKVNYLESQVKVEEFRDYNLLRQNTKLFVSVNNSKKLLSRLLEYNPNGTLHLSMEVKNLKKNRVDSITYTYNAMTRTSCGYLKTPDSLILSFELAFNADKRLISRKFYISRHGKQAGSDGREAKFTVGDISLARYSYDNRGLIAEELVYLNGILQHRYTYNYQ